VYQIKKKILARILQAELGNLAAGMRAKIHLTYKTELKVVNGEICFFLPTTIAPIYVPVEDKSSVTATSASTNHGLQPIAFLRPSSMMQDLLLYYSF